MKWLGVILVLFGLSLGTTGMHLIRMSELKKKEGQDKECRFYFFLGMIFNVLLGPLLDIAGYAFAPAALIAPFTGINIIINSVVAPYTLGEELTPRRLFSASVVFIAATSSIVFKNLGFPKKWWKLTSVGSCKAWSQRSWNKAFLGSDLMGV